MDKLTDQKLKNKRFRCNEDKIVSVLLLSKEKMSLERLARLSHLSRSTIYRHHGSIQDIIPNYEKYILKKCRSIVKRQMNLKNSHIKSLYQRIIIFLSANKKIMKLILRDGNQNIIEDIIFLLKPIIINTTSIVDGEMFVLYSKEVAGLIEEWCKAGYRLDDCIIIINKIEHLTSTAYLYYKPLSSFDRST